MASKITINKKPNAQQQFAKMAGFGLNLKLVLYMQSQCLTESLGFLNPPLLQAAKRCVQHIFRTYAESFSPIFSERNLLKLLPKNFA